MSRAIIYLMDMSLYVKRIKHWGLKGGLGILDQGLYSGVNFLLGILLARWLSPAMYGSFSAAYSLFLLFSVAQVALIAEPMSILGVDQYRHNITSYLNYLLRVQLIASILPFLLMLLSTLFITNNMLRDTMIAMGSALPLILYYWYLRRAFYLEMQSGMAMLTSLIYSVLLLLIVFLIQLVGHLTASAAYWAISLSSLVAGLFALKRLGLQLFGEWGDQASLNPRIVNRQLWEFGKWILPAYLAGWFTTLSFPFLITIFLNAQSAGAFRALQNLFLPFHQLLAAITLLVLPWLSRQKTEHGSATLFAATQVVAGITGLFAMLYCLVIVIFRREIVDFLYSSPFYSSFDYLIIFLAISTLLGSAPLILGLALRVLGQQNIILWSKGSGAIFTLIFGIPIIWMLHMKGVIVSLIGGVFIETIILLFFYFRIRKPISF